MLHPTGFEPFGKPPNPNALPLPSGWVLRLDMHELVLSAPFAEVASPPPAQKEGS
ncbi:hypothetical protein BQ8794_40069 [Mesorhizobium prunaredense]|uniref:Uncharacterized protein n=1 Tax=Mesorhizobium prunaredense TaxID=1631249 RepID=A0A1R3VC16_9HYPH|nr:hypothetical protein BQ8794_40069 [Mesorhizobium prunaredense]